LQVYNFSLILQNNTKKRYLWDNTTWRTGRAGGPCFQMKNVNCRRAAQKTRQKGGPAGCRKGGAAGCEKGRGELQKRAALRTALFPHPSLMCSPLAPLNVQSTDNTKRRAGRAGGPCCQMKNMKFPRTGELHRRAGRQAALQNGPVGCILRQAGGLHIKLGCQNGRVGGLPFSAVRLAIFRSPPFCLLCSPPKVNVFHLETRPSSPPGPPALQLVLSQSTCQSCSSAACRTALLCSLPARG